MFVDDRNRWHFGNEGEDVGDGWQFTRGDQQRHQRDHCQRNPLDTRGYEDGNRGRAGHVLNLPRDQLEHDVLTSTLRSCSATGVPHADGASCANLRCVLRRGEGGPVPDRDISRGAANSSTPAWAASRARSALSKAVLWVTDCIERACEEGWRCGNEVKRFA
jgi:hypothetical protein